MSKYFIMMLSTCHLECVIRYTLCQLAQKPQVTQNVNIVDSKYMTNMRCWTTWNIWVGWHLWLKCKRQWKAFSLIGVHVNEKSKNGFEVFTYRWIELIYSQQSLPMNSFNKYQSVCSVRERRESSIILSTWTVLNLLTSQKVRTRRTSKHNRANYRWSHHNKFIHSNDLPIPRRYPTELTKFRCSPKQIHWFSCYA